MNKHLHILRLLNRKFYLLYLLLLCSSMACIPLIYTDWCTLIVSVNLKIPFSDILIQPRTILVTGKDVLGYFSILPVIPLTLVYFQYTRQYAWMAAVLMIFVTLLHLINIQSVFDFVQSKSPDALTFKIEFSNSLFTYFGLTTAQTLIAFLISKTS